MQFISKNYSNFFGQFLFIFSVSFCLTISGNLGAAKAQGTGESTNPVSQHIIAQAAPSQPTRPRLRTPFFEEERKPKFGQGDFLQSALDGVNNFFAADSINHLSDVTLNEFSSPLTSNISGTLTVLSRDQDSPNFLTTTFVAPGTNLVFTSPSYGSDPRIGSLTVNGNVTVGGQTLTLNNVRSYSGSFSAKNELVSGAIQLVDPRNPGTTLLIQLPPTIIPNVNDDNVPISAPATLSIGLPTDR